MSILCNIQNLSLSFGNKVIFKQTGFALQHGDRVGLIGPNGKGKSSLFKILLGNVSPDKTTPSFIFDKAKVEQGENFEYSVFLVPQDFQYHIPNPPSIKDYFFEHYPLLKKAFEKLNDINHQLESTQDESLIHEQEKCLQLIEQLKGWEILNKYKSYLKLFKVDDIERSVHNLSGGEQRKILLSLGFSSPANLILWDEPTNHLDIGTIKRLEEELLQLNKTYIIISHDRYMLSKVVSKILHINNGTIEDFKGDYTTYLNYLSQKEEQRKVQLSRIQNSLRRETEWMRQGIKARGTRSKKRVENFHDLSKAVSNLKEQARQSMQLSLSGSQRKTKKLLELKDASFTIDSKELFRNLNLSLFKGQKIGLVGPNGAGKTSLINIFTEKYQLTSGLLKKADDLTINYFTQNREELDPTVSPFELLGDGQDHIHFANGYKQHVIGYFQKFLFNKDEVHRPLSTFSGGELARLQLASQLMKFSDIWIFDEPTNDLDIETIEILEQSLKDFEGSVILISHDRTFLENVTDVVWVIEDKNIQEFSGGFSQAAPYLEALFLEEEIVFENSQSEDVSVLKESQSQALNKEDVLEIKKSSHDLKEIQNQIEIKEKLIEDIDKLLIQFDFSTNDPEKAKLYKQLLTKKEQIEEELLGLYEEQS